MAKAARRATQHPRAQRRTVGRPTRLALLAILVLGALLRIGYLHEVSQQPDFDHPLVDAGFHDYWARGLAFGEWQPPFGDPDPKVRSSPFIRPPGYPYLLALTYKMTGGGYVGARIVQMAFGLVNVVLGFLLGRRLFGPLPGLITAALIATYPFSIYFDGELQATTLATTLLLLQTLVQGTWLQGITWRRSLLTGALIGLGALVRPNFLILLPTAMVWSLWQLQAHRPWRRFIRGAAGLLAGCALVLLPSAARNYAASGELVPITFLGGINFYIGNNPDADGLPPQTIPGLGDYRTCYDFPALMRNMEAQTGRKVGYGEFSSILAGRGLAWVRENPGRAALLTWHKALLFWGPVEISNNKEVELERENSAVLRILPWNFPFLLGLALLGAVSLVLRRGRTEQAATDAIDAIDAISTRRRALLWLVVLTILGWFASILPFIVASRYRAPMVPLIMVLSAWGVHTVWAAVRARRWPAVASWTGLGTGLVLLASVNAAGYEVNRARWHYSRGYIHAYDHEWAQAIEELSAAIRIQPDYAAAYIDLGAALQGAGRLDEATRVLRRAVELDPGSATANYNLAAVLASRGQFDESREFLRRALILDPGHRGAKQALEYIERMPTGK